MVKMGNISSEWTNIERLFLIGRMADKIVTTNCLYSLNTDNLATIIYLLVNKDSFFLESNRKQILEDAGIE